MTKGNKIFLIIITICTIVVVGVCAWAILNHEEEIKKESESDAIKFKKEYENVNGSKIDSSNEVYQTITINENNTVKYVTAKEAIEILKTGTGVIYFGFDTSLNSRSVVETLTKVTKELNATLYYLDIEDIRSEFQVIDGVASQVESGTDEYYEIIKLLDNELSEYLITDGTNKYTTNEKRLVAPSVVAVKGGEITGFHEGTVASHKKETDKLTEKELNELNKTYTKLVKTIQANTCTPTGC